MRRATRLWIALGLNAVIVVGQVVAGIAASSVGLVADAAHNLSDVAAVVVSLVAVRLALRPATPQRSFGFHRATILGAQANAAMLLVVTLVVMVEGVRRLADPDPVEGGIVVVVAGVAVLANSAAAWVLARDQGHGQDLNMRSAFLHMVSDALVSVGVMVSGAVILVVGGWYWLDPAVSIVISAAVGWRAWRLLVQTADVLLESTPDGVDAAAVATAIRAVPGVDDVHDLHVWSLSSDLRALAAHVVVDGEPTLADAQQFGVAVKAMLAEDWAIEHATLEFECATCAPTCAAEVTDVGAVAPAHRH